MEQIDHNELMEHFTQEIKWKSPEEIENLKNGIESLGLWPELTAIIQNKISEILQEENADYEINNIKEKIIKEIIDNKFITATEGIEEEYKWTIITIDLPKTETFKWFSCKYFISKEYLTKDELEERLNQHPEYNEKLASTQDVTDILENIKHYTWDKVDKNIDNYFEYLNPETWEQRCDAWDILKKIPTWLELELLWLKNKEDIFRVVWSLLDDKCFFNRYGFSSSCANLFLVIS